jgi:hypothetical protein
LSEAIWSLTSLRAKRISGPKKFRSSGGKDFFNTIPLKADSSRTSLEVRFVPTSEVLNRSMPFSHSRSWQPSLGSLGRTRTAFTDLRLFARVILEGGMELKISRRQVTIGGVTLLAGTSMGTSVQAQRDRPLKRAIEDVEKREEVRIAERLTPKELASSTVYRRAVDAVIWGLPLVGEDTVKQAAFRDGKASYNDIVWWPKGGGWKNQSPTPNVNTRYMYFFINTRLDGPVVVEIPPAVTGSSFYGTIEDAWYEPLIDVGLEGKGGKYLVLPPDYKGDVPEGYAAVRPNTYNTIRR